MSWWEEKRFRMIQNNLRDTDASMDTERYAERLLDFGADVCMVGCGGITAFYESKLECQKRSPYLKGDFFGRLVESCHSRGIRVIARFDFSKANTAYLKCHPEWFTVSGMEDGGPVLFHDTAATCVNGPYQQECSLEILKEVIERYPVDGVFFNMFGYQTRDYSGKYTGICQCENCKSAFSSYSKGLKLPESEDSNDPVFRLYQDFKRDTVEKLMLKIRDRVRALNPEAAVCTYHHGGVDLVRNESNSAVDRPLPFLLMASESNAATVRGTYRNKFSTNCCINAVDIFYRFMGVSKYLNALRLYAAMACGGNLDWCIIGGFEDYPDRSNFPLVKEIFRFHQKYETYFSALESKARVLLLNPHPFGGSSAGAGEYNGLFRMLKEEHILFDVMDASEGAAVADRMEQYDTIFLPGITKLDVRIVDALKDTRTTVVATGLTMAGQPEELKDIFGVTLEEKLEPVRGAYFYTDQKDVWEHFEDRDWVYLDREYYFTKLDEGSEGFLPLVAPARYGPPERCFGHRVTEQPGAVVRHNQMLYFPWKPGSLYFNQGYEDFKYLVLDLLKYVDRGRTVPDTGIEIKAPKNVELFFDRCGPGQYLIQLLNLSGFQGTTVWEPLPVHKIKLNFKNLKPLSLKRLGTGGEKTIEAGRTVTVDLEGMYLALLLETE